MNVVCFGDSNTYGYDPRSYFGEQYPPEDRWPDILAAAGGFTVKNQGMNGRMIPTFHVPFSESTDKLIVMLGTNDLLQGVEPAEITRRMENFLMSLTIDRHKVLLIAPPPMIQGAWVDTPALLAKSKQLGTSYRDLSVKLKVNFVDSGMWDIPLCYDGVHFTAQGHRVFAEKLFQYIQKEGRKTCLKLE